MKIEKIDQNQLKITLSCTEMLQMNLEITPQESQNILTNLLYSLETDYQFSIMNHKIILEMIPSRQDGCNLFITKIQAEQIKTDHSMRLLIFSFVQWETVEYAENLISGSFAGECAICRLDGLYYLILYLDSLAQEEQIMLLLSDFGECVKHPKLFESVLKEYGTPLSQCDSFRKTSP